MTPEIAYVFEARRDDPLHEVRVVGEALRPPADGEVLLAIERFAVASNNLTYALLGDQLGHWAAFPASSPEWGRVPAWGYAVVIDGDPALATPGSRWSGYLPMATHVTVRVERHGERLRAVAPERAGMLPLYRDLSPVAGHEDDRSAVAMLPGVAAALLDELVAGIGIGRVVVSSATSKTALASALLLSRRGIDVVGITSPAHVEAAGLAGMYGEVIAYADVDTIAPSPEVIYLDVAGLPAVTAAVHACLGSSLKRSIAVGGSHRAAAAQPPTVPAGPPVERFNSGARRVHLVSEFGERAVTDLEDRARTAIVQWASAHVNVPETVGVESIAAVWARLVHGDVPPLTAPVVAPAA
ncbi:DUF2855 family protein [Amycolatopsis sp. CA-126428]|uniref:DUF2855 family protein n=1 Tax=Amycolatopsis sp. CA-126428 TaxID=2073158 RepID=UPI000CD23682|nr:DUF2855 family protein [Amycolatopsis sp. CA-126428]